MAADAAPSKPLRVIVIFSFLPSALSRLEPVSFEPQASARCGERAQRPSVPCPPTKPFYGIHETTLKQTGANSTADGAAAKFAAKFALEAHMNHSIHSADRSTHLKIVVVALVAGIVVAVLGISARTNADYSQTAHIVKAGKPVALTSSDTMVVR
jgi:hypothetical protein